MYAQASQWRIVIRYNPWISKDANNGLMKIKLSWVLSSVMLTFYVKLKTYGNKWSWFRLEIYNSQIQDRQLNIENVLTLRSSVIFYMYIKTILMCFLYKCKFMSLYMWRDYILTLFSLSHLNNWVLFDNFFLFLWKVQSRISHLYEPNIFQKNQFLQLFLLWTNVTLQGTARMDRDLKFQYFKTITQLNSQ